jgi:hypothetical protein
MTSPDSAAQRSQASGVTSLVSPPLKAFRKDSGIETKKAGVAEYPKVIRHAGLLCNTSPEKDRATIYQVIREGMCEIKVSRHSISNALYHLLVNKQGAISLFLPPNV